MAGSASMCSGSRAGSLVAARARSGLSLCPAADCCGRRTLLVNRADYEVLALSSIVTVPDPDRLGLATPGDPAV
jgi:hypothetical protein